MGATTTVPSAIIHPSMPLGPTGSIIVAIAPMHRVTIVGRTPRIDASHSGRTTGRVAIIARIPLTDVSHSGPTMRRGMIGGPIGRTDATMSGGIISEQDGITCPPAESFATAAGSRTHRRSRVGDQSCPLW